jgi:hypothetical protein
MGIIALVLVSWVAGFPFGRWNEEVLVIDTANVSSDEATGKILSSLHVG